MVKADGHVRRDLVFATLVRSSCPSAFAASSWPACWRR